MNVRRYSVKLAGWHFSLFAQTDKSEKSTSLADRNNSIPLHFTIIISIIIIIIITNNNINKYYNKINYTWDSERLAPSCTRL